MSAPGVPYLELINHLEGASSGQAQATLEDLLDQPGDEGSALAKLIADALQRFESTSAIIRGLDLVARRLSDSEIIEELLVVSQRLAAGSLGAITDPTIRPLRQAVLQRLIEVRDPRAREHIYSLVSDTDRELREAAMAAIPEATKMPSSNATGTAALTVFKDADDQQDAVELLEQLEHATHTLRDMGDLNEGQVAIIDDLMLPRIQELNDLFGTRPASRDDQLAARKRAFGTGSILIGSAMAAAQGIDGLAKAGEPYQAVSNAAGALHSLLESLPDLIRRSQPPLTGESDGAQEPE